MIHNMMATCGSIEIHKEGKCDVSMVMQVHAQISQKVRYVGVYVCMAQSTGEKLPYQALLLLPKIFGPIAKHGHK